MNGKGLEVDIPRAMRRFGFKIVSVLGQKTTHAAEDWFQVVGKGENVAWNAWRWPNGKHGVLHKPAACVGYGRVYEDQERTTLSR